MCDIALDSPSSVLSFWFGTLDTALLGDINHIKARMAIWFSRSSPEFEKTQAFNAHLIDNLLLHQSSDPEWETPKGLLARIIVLDQFPRSVYRGTAEAFRYDEFAAKFATVIVEKGWYTSMFSAIERLFIIV